MVICSLYPINRSKPIKSEKAPFMPKTCKIFLLSLCLSCSLAIGQTKPAEGSGAWLEPTDTVIAKAIDDGFSEKKLPKDARYHKILNWIKPGLDARIEVI